MATPQNGLLQLQPPPIPSRRRSPVDSRMCAPVDPPTVTSGKLSPPIPRRRTTLENKRLQQTGTTRVGDNSSQGKANFSKSNSMFSEDSALIAFDAHDSSRPNSVFVSSRSGFSDLEGIDFTAGQDSESVGAGVGLAFSNKLSSSTDDLTTKSQDPVYPDISAAFREVRGNTMPSPVMPMLGVYNVLNAGVGYGWNPFFVDSQPGTSHLISAGNGSKTGAGLSSVSENGSRDGYQTGSNWVGFPVNGIGSSNNQINPNISGLSSNMFAGSNNDLQLHRGPLGMPKVASWSSALGTQPAVTQEQSTFLGTRELKQDFRHTPGFDEDVDLIELPPGLPEHEYLSLDYFDPLYERGRKEFALAPDGGVNYSLGEAFPSFAYDGYPPPELRKHVRRESNEIWGISTSKKSEHVSGSSNIPIGFEAFTADSMFGCSDEEFLKSQGHMDTVHQDEVDTLNQEAELFNKLSTAQIAEGPKRPPSISKPQNQTTRYEKLRKRIFIDPESDAFCQMVSELKKKYISQDESTNLGYLLSSMHTTYTPSTQVKVVIYPPLELEPVTFTCDTNTLVEHLISQVLYSALPLLGKQHTATDYILKVYDRTEYLKSDLPLSRFEYTHSCLKLDSDLMFEMVAIEQVPRPFIRTVDDDELKLVFPREYIKTDSAIVSKEALDILLDNFYQAVDRLNNQALQGQVERVQMQGLHQSVKAVCAILGKIETTDITKSLNRLERLVADMDGPNSQANKMFVGYTASADADTLNAIKNPPQGTVRHAELRPLTLSFDPDFIRGPLLEELQDVIDQVVAAVKQLVRMFCQTYHTDFFLGSSVNIPHNQTEVTQILDNFIVHIASAHNFPHTVKNQFDEFRVVCSLYHGIHRLHSDCITSNQRLKTTGLCDRIVWDEWLQFEVPLCKLPREMRLCLTLCGLQYAQGTDSSTKPQSFTILPVGAVAIQLYNQRGHLLQGSQLLPLTMGVSADPMMPSCRTLLPDSVLLQVNFPDFDKTIYFPPVVCVSQPSHKSFETLTPDIQSSIRNIMEKDYVATLNAVEMDMIWRYRHYLYNYPTALPRILQGMHARSWDWNSLIDLRALLAAWPPLHLTQAIELLLPQYSDQSVREFAAQSLSNVPADDLVHFLPQLIQALKFENYHNSPLARLLLETSCKSIRFAHQFFWLLKGVGGQDASYKRRYELMFVALASVAGDSLYQEFHKQEALVKIMTGVAEKVKASKDKDATLKRELQVIYEFMESNGRLLLPYNPSVEVTGIDTKSCSYFTSNAFPLKLVFRNSNPKADPVYVMYKVGDDLRQDMLTLQVIRIMDMLWLQKGLDLKIITFACLATGPKRGVIELITESDTLRKIQMSSGVTGSFKDRPIKEWLQKHNPTELEYKKAVENFMYSCAGYCVATYVLGIGDRHNDNIMLTQSGHMFHIDFSKFLGDAQMFGNIKRDRVPFVLTSDMAYVINDGGRQSDQFQHFIDLCCQAFNILRQHSDLFRNLFMLMSRSGIPGVTEHAVLYIQRALLPGQTNAQATATFTRMIEDSLKSVFTQFNFFIHNLAQLKFSSHSEGALLSFVPKTYSMQTDGRITSVAVHSYQKRYTPEKHYIYILHVDRENQRVSTYIFRMFAEFVEFRDKLAEMFPLVTWSNFSTRVVLGRSNVRSVAESRKAEISQFLQELRSKATEISDCDLVYTFFHPLLRDEQEADKTKVAKFKEIAPAPSISAGSNTGIQGQIKLSILYKMDSLQVMIMHLKDMVQGTELPSPYVKTYLLPDPDKQTKRKTKIARNTAHPTYNEVLMYKMKESELHQRILQVTVWDHDMLKENNFLGAVYIRLRDLDLRTETSKWYQLQKLQMSGNGMPT